MKAPWTKAEIGRAYKDSPELHEDVASLAAFKRVVRVIEAMQGGQGQEHAAAVLGSVKWSDDGQLVAVSAVHYYRTDFENAVRGAKYLLLGAGGVACLANWDGDSFWKGFFELPKERKA